MKKIVRVIALLIIISMMATLSIGCGKDSELETSSDPESESIVLRFNMNMSKNDLDNSMRGQIIQNCIEEIERESEGRLKIDVFLDSQLGKTPSEVIGGAQSGSFEMFNHNAAAWGEYTNAFLPVNIPYLFTDVRVLQEFLNGQEGQKIKDQVLAETDARIVFFSYPGFRHIVNNKRPITKPEDLKGLKMRVMSDPYTIKAFEGFGASTVQLSYGELYTSSQQGLIDGFDGAYLDILNSKLYEVQKYLSETRNLYTLEVYCISDTAYQSLPEDLRNIFDNAFAKAQDLAEKEDPQIEEALEELKEKMTFNEISDEDIQSFVEATQPLWDEARAELGEENWNDIIMEIETIKKSLGIN